MGDGSSYLRQVIESYRRPAEVLAITSGKGGVGKTNIAANLAICLSASGKKVLLFDADMSLGNLDVILNINSKYNISHVVHGQKSLGQVIQFGVGGVDIICGGSGLEKLSNINEFQCQMLTQELSKLKNSYNLILIDTGAGISKLVVGFCLFADHVLVVTTPEVTAMTDAYAMIKVLVKNNYAGRISVIVNIAQSLQEGKKTYQQIAKVARCFLNTHVYAAGVLVKDDRLLSAVRLRIPIAIAYPKSRLTSSLAAMAAKLGDSLTAQNGEVAFLRKLLIGSSKVLV